MTIGRRSASTLLALLLALLGRAGAGDAQERPSPVRDSLQVAGKVLDRVGGEELPAVRVSLVLVEPGARETVVWQGTTDESGSFLSARVPAVLYELRAEALAFEPLSETLDLRGRRQVAVRIELVPRAVELEPVVAVSQGRSRLESSGFYDRRRMGTGHTFTREEIEARNALRVSDLLRAVPGVQVIPGRGGVGATLRYRGSCQPDLVVDGIAVSRPGSIDDILSVGDLEALEIHSGTYQPARAGARSCGTVLAWTREGNPAEGSPMTWRRGLFAVAVVIVSILLVR
jgi:hypothetical protein